MKTLPSFQTSDLSLSNLQSRWATLLNPLLRQPLNSGTTLGPITLAVGNNVINHTLGRMQQGWMLTDVDGAAVIYRSAPFNDKTITLNSDAIVSVQLFVY
jgi:hypothetical protein